MFILSAIICVVFICIFAGLTVARIFQATSPNSEQLVSVYNALEPGPEASDSRQAGLEDALYS